MTGNDLTTEGALGADEEKREMNNNERRSIKPSDMFVLHSSAILAAVDFSNPVLILVLPSESRLAK